MRRVSLIVAVLGLIVAGMLPAYSHPGPHPVEDRGFIDHGGGVIGRDDGAGDHHHDVHGARRGHLPPEQENVKRLGGVRLTDIEDDISDVSSLERITKTSAGAFVDEEGLASKDGRRYAYLGNWTADCATGGVHIVDYTNPAAPVQVRYVDATGKTYRTEGIHAIKLDTPSFTGDVLALSNEWCADPSTSPGGFTLLDITNPRRPRPLVDGYGDFGAPRNAPSGPFTGALIGANESHSVIAWDAGNKAYLAAIDNAELTDVDLFDITNPRAPVQIADTGLTEWSGIEVDAYGTEATSHDFDITWDGDQWLLTVSYWDAGWVILDVTDPRRPVVLDDSNYDECDPVFEGVCPPEGNAHQGEWNRAHTLWLGTDEDQSPFRLPITVTSGPMEGAEYPAGEFSWTVPAEVALPDGTVNGPLVYGGYGCPDDRGEIPPPSVLGPLGPDEEAIIVFQRGPVEDPNNPGEACLFSEKVESGQLAGYDVVIVANHHAGSLEGFSPDAFLCGSMGHQFDVQVVGLCVGHRFLHEIFGYPPDYSLPYPSGDPGDVEPDVGDLSTGEISAASEFDGWGYVRLLNRQLEEIGQCSLPEQGDPDFATGFGDLSVHEVEVDRDPRYDGLAYFSWYDAGFRVFEYAADGSCEQVGVHIGSGGNDLWGVAQGLDAAGNRIVLASDRDFGLIIYRYTGPLP